MTHASAQLSAPPGGPAPAGILGVAGMVGAGKSTLAAALAARFGMRVAPERVADNPWLEPYYAGGPVSRRAYALRLQLHFLAARFGALREIRARGGAWVLDRTWYEDAEVFARGLWEDGTMGDLDWRLYRELYGELLHLPAARPPRLLVYLHAPFGVVLERIARRGRPGEQGTDPAYWAALYGRYERWIAGFRECPVLAVDVREYDLVGGRGVDEVVGRVERALRGEA